MLDANKETLKGLANNKSLFDVVKATVLQSFLDDDLTFEMTDEQIGQITRARITGIKKVEEAFRSIASCASAEKSPDTVNPAY